MKTIWSPLLVFRPPVGEKDNVILSDGLASKTVLVNREKLFELILYDLCFENEHKSSELASQLKEFGLRDVEIDPSLFSAIRHWWDRGWHPALSFFLWSRNINYFDRMDATRDRRKVALRSYLEESEAPERIVPEGEEISLPSPEMPPIDINFGELLLRRRTIRKYKKAPLRLQSLSDTLWYGLNRVRQARVDPTNDVLDYLTSYGVAFDFYLVVYDVEEITPGVYFYNLKNHELIRLRQGIYREEMTHNLFGQRAPETAVCTVLLVADFSQYQWRYRHERALLNLYTDAGRIAHEFITIAGAYKMACFMTPATRDRATEGLLNLDNLKQGIVYSLTVGLDSRVDKA